MSELDLSKITLGLKSRWKIRLHGSNDAYHMVGTANGYNLGLSQATGAYRPQGTVEPFHMKGSRDGTFGGTVTLHEDEPTVAMLRLDNYLDVLILPSGQESSSLNMELTRGVLDSWDLDGPNDESLVEIKFSMKGLAKYVT